MYLLRFYNIPEKDVYTLCCTVLIQIKLRNTTYFTNISLGKIIK